MAGKNGNWACFFSHESCNSHSWPKVFARKFFHARSRNPSREFLRCFPSQIDFSKSTPCTYMKKIRICSKSLHSAFALRGKIPFRKGGHASFRRFVLAFFHGEFLSLFFYDSESISFPLVLPFSRSTFSVGKVRQFSLRSQRRRNPDSCAQKESRVLFSSFEKEVRPENVLED